MNTSLQRGPKEAPNFLTEIAPLTILVVDDSRSFGDLAAALLELEPCTHVVGQARSGAEALEKIVSLHPDVVLMDVQMTPMGGLTAAALIGWLFPQSHVVMMSSDDSPRLRAECAASGATAFIHKSSFIADFFQAIGPIAREQTNQQRALAKRDQQMRALAV
jgi:two-component system, NarL family, invasion response regulator UvrY